MGTDPRQNGCYIARKPCDCLIATAYDLRDKGTGKEVAKWISSGLIVTHVTWAEFQAIVSQEQYGCTHQEAHV